MTTASSVFILSSQSDLLRRQNRLALRRRHDLIVNPPPPPPAWGGRSGFSRRAEREGEGAGTEGRARGGMATAWRPGPRGAARRALAPPRRPPRHHPAGRRRHDPAGRPRPGGLAGGGARRRPRRLGPRPRRDRLRDAPAGPRDPSGAPPPAPRASGRGWLNSRAPPTSVTPGPRASEDRPRRPATRARRSGTALRPQARAGRASSVQMLILRVSGIKNRASTNMIAGSPIGYASAQPRLPVDRYAEVVMIGTRPPPQPLPM